MGESDTSVWAAFNPTIARSRLNPCAGDTGGVHIRLAVAVVIGGWLTAVLTLWAGSYPTGGLMAALVAAGLLLVNGAVWLVFVVRELVERRFALVAFTTAAVLVLIAGAAFASRIELPLLARFAMVRPAFDRVVAERAAGGDNADRCPARIGSYRITNCRTVGTGTYFTERDGGFLNGVGFAYLPGGPPSGSPMGGSITYSQLRGSWYWYVEEW